MKMKKITAFIVAILSVLTIASFAPVAKVSAATDASFVHGFSSYSLEYVLDKFDVETEENVEYGYAYGVQGGELGEVITASHTFSGNVEDTFAIEIYKLGKDDEGNQTKEVVKSATFSLVLKTTEADLYYVVTDEAIAAYNSEIYAKDAEGNETGKLAGKELGDSFTYPDLDDVLVSNYFDYNVLKSNLTLYYCKPTSQSFASTTSKSFTLDQVGTYRFYVLAKDPTGTAMTIDTEKLTDKGNGWYDESDNLIVPIFSFSFANVTGPEITISAKNKVENGYIGLTYQDAKDYITIVANNEHVKYELWYSASDLSTSGDDWKNTSAEDLEKLGAVLVNEDYEGYEEIAFDDSTLYFTPNKTGSYYVLVTVADDYGEDHAITFAINVESGFDEVKYDTQFLKNNWLSFMFLGIALLSLVGIVLLIFIKPKEEVEEEVNIISKK